MKITGIILLIIGVVMTIFTTFKYFTKEEVVDIGKLEISKVKPHKVVWSPVVGIVLMGIGGVILWQTAKNNS